MIAPALKKGGVIGLCAPCQLPAPERYAPVLDALRRRGFTVREAENLYKDTDGYLATPQERAADFNQPASMSPPTAPTWWTRYGRAPGL